MTAAAAPAAAAAAAAGPNGGVTEAEWTAIVEYLYAPGDARAVAMLLWEPIARQARAAGHHSSAPLPSLTLASPRRPSLRLTRRQGQQQAAAAAKQQQQLGVGPPRRGVAAAAAVPRRSACLHSCGRCPWATSRWECGGGRKGTGQRYERDEAPGALPPSLPPSQALAGRLNPTGRLPWATFMQASVGDSTTATMLASTRESGAPPPPSSPHPPSSPSLPPHRPPQVVLDFQLRGHERWALGRAAQPPW